MSGDSASPEPADGTAARVLVVDDDAVVREAISMVLTDEGYDCATTSGADAALELVRTTDPHLVISDMKMPGKDGLWLLDRLRRERPDTAVVMLTAYGDTEAAVECLRRGATDYLLKPPKSTDLLRA
ncbi:MAG TPA: response regulator, partial [Anaeromyxobacteraceae bacterium]|nr:response regulator [Anaeromyxobacteraceae bacterium]